MNYIHKSHTERRTTEGEPYQVLVSTRSGLADRDFTLRQFEEAASDGEVGIQPEVFRRSHRPDEVTLIDSADVVRELYYDRSTASSELRKQQALYAAARSRELTQWKSYFAAYMKRWRQSHTQYRPIKRYHVVRKTRTIEWFATIRVLRSDAKRLGLLTEKGRAMSDLQLGSLLRDYKPSNALALGPAKTTMHVKVRYQKLVTYYVKELKSVKLKRILPSRVESRRARLDFISQNPVPTWKTSPTLRSLAEKVNKLRARASHEWHRLLAIVSTGQADLRNLAKPVVGLLYGMSPGAEPIGYGPVPSQSLNASYYAASPASALERALALGPHRMVLRPVPNVVHSSDTTTDETVFREWPYDKATLIRAMNHKLRVEDTEPIHERVNRARLALENLEVGSDDLDRIDFNVFRSVAELKDFKGASAKKFLNWLRIAGTSKVDVVLGSLRKAAELYLAYQFAVKPTVNDINTLLTHTRQHLLSCRRGLFQLANHLDLFHEGQITIRKGISSDWRLPKELPSNGYNLPLDAEVSLARLGLRSEFSLYVEYGPTRWSWGKLPYLNTAGTYVNSGLFRIPDGYPDLADILDDETVSGYVNRCGPIFALDDSRAFLFQEWLAAELRRAIDPSQVRNLVEDMKLVKNTWELTPLSFIVDWFSNTGAIARTLQSVVSAASSKLSPASAPWISHPRRLLAYVPRYKITRWTNFVGPKTAEMTEHWSSNAAFLLGWQRQSVQGRFQLTEVKVFDLGVRSFLRYPIGFPDFAAVMLPKFQVNLDYGKLTTILAMLTSGL